MTDASSPTPAGSGDGWPAGPAVAVLVQRLALAPPDVLDPRVAAPALVCDVVEALGGGLPSAPELDRLARALAPAGPASSGPSVRRGDAVAGLLCWLLWDPRVHRDPGLCARWSAGGLLPWFLSVLERLVAEVAVVREPREWVRDEGGREEAARAFCRFGGVLPAGESAAVAEDRWRSVSTAYQREVSLAMAEHVRRREELARALAEKKAKEAAAQYANY